MKGPLLLQGSFTCLNTALGCYQLLSEHKKTPICSGYEESAYLNRDIFGYLAPVGKHETQSMASESSGSNLMQEARLWAAHQRVPTEQRRGWEIPVEGEQGQDR